MNTIPDSRSAVETALEGYLDALPSSAAEEPGTVLVCIMLSAK